MKIKRFISILLFASLGFLTSCTNPDSPALPSDTDGSIPDNSLPIPDNNLPESETKTSATSPDFTDMSGNPIFTSIFTADPSAHVWQHAPDKIYVYPSHDIFPSRGCDLMDKYHVFSSVNMADWIDEGEILSSDDNSWGRSEGGFMWAPDCAYKNGVYYFYYPHPTGSGNLWNTTWKIGVATSDKPASDFIDKGMVTMASDGDGFIDPCVFEDDDGIFYMVVGGSQRCYIGKMGDDMLTIDGEWLELSDQLPHYHEGPWLFKRNDFYYLMYPGKVKNTDPGDCMLYAMSNNPTGPWEYKGSILDPVSTGDTSHGSIVEFKNHWYLFYHNAEISGGNGTLRSVCVDEVFWNDDGTIQKVEQTITGIKAIGGRIPSNTPGLEMKYYDIKSDNYANYTEKTVYWADSSDCIIEKANLQNGNVHNLHIEGAYVEFSNIDGGNGGKVLLTVIYASAENSSSKVETSGDINGGGYYLKLPKTEGWDDYSGQAKRLIDLKPGKDNIIRLTGGMGGFNVEAISVSLIP